MRDQVVRARILKELEVLLKLVNWERWRILTISAVPAGRRRQRGQSMRQQAGIYDCSINSDPAMLRTLCDDFGKVVIYRDGFPHFCAETMATQYALSCSTSREAKRHIGKWVPVTA